MGAELSFQLRLLLAGRPDLMSRVLSIVFYSQFRQCPITLESIQGYPDPKAQGIWFLRFLFDLLLLSDRD